MVSFTTTAFGDTNRSTYEIFKKIACKNAFVGRAILPTAAKRYQTEYFTEIYKHKNMRGVSLAEFSSKLKQARNVLIADYHTDPKSQEFTVQVMTEMANTAPTTIVIEWIEQRHQKYIDQYLEGRVGLREVKNKIEFDQIWGFNWKSYKSILVQAKRLRVRILATEQRQDTANIRERDSKIAERVKADSMASPNQRYLITYGTFHVLGKNHLRDKLVKSSIPIDMTIVDDLGVNMDRAYLQHPEADILGFKDNLYYIKLGDPLERAVIEFAYYKKIGLYD